MHYGFNTSIWYLFVLFGALFMILPSMLTRTEKKNSQTIIRIVILSLGLAMIPLSIFTFNEIQLMGLYLSRVPIHLLVIGLLLPVIIILEKFLPLEFGIKSDALSIND